MPNDSLPAVGCQIRQIFQPHILLQQAKDQAGIEVVTGANRALGLNGWGIVMLFLTAGIEIHAFGFVGCDQPVAIELNVVGIDPLAILLPEQVEKVLV